MQHLNRVHQENPHASLIVQRYKKFLMSPLITSEELDDECGALCFEEVGDCTVHVQLNRT